MSIIKEIGKMFIPAKNVHYCHYCGRRLGKEEHSTCKGEKRYCPYCGTRTSKRDCPKCGYYW